MKKSTVGTKNFRGKILCASEIGLYHRVVARVKDYTRENTRQLLYNVNMYMLNTHQIIMCILCLLDLIEILDLEEPHFSILQL